VSEKPKRFVRMFKPRFAPLVKSGKKRQTMRPTPKQMPRSGDIIDCREWSGKPYRSKQNKLVESTITNVRMARLSPTARFFLDNIEIDKADDLRAFARADGFSDWWELLEWFMETHGLPFDGILILWQ